MRLNVLTFQNLIVILDFLLVGRGRKFLTRNRVQQFDRSTLQSDQSNAVTCQIKFSTLFYQSRYVVLFKVDRLEELQYCISSPLVDDCIELDLKSPQKCKLRSHYLIQFPSLCQPLSVFPKLSLQVVNFQPKVFLKQRTAQNMIL